MSTPIAQAPGPPAPPANGEDDAIPLLKDGDQLSRPEFERRYEAMPEVKAELIEGIVYIMASPVSFNRHSKPHAQVIEWLGRYLDSTPGVDRGADGSVRIDMDNMAQPDAFLFIKPESGGRVRFTDEDYLQVTPELVVEVAASSASYDLHGKLRVYRDQGTPEYIVWRTRDQAIDWFVLRDGEYTRLAPGADGILRSEVFPGLWLDPAALIQDDRGAMVRVNRMGVESPEHAAFIANLRREP